MPAAPEGAEGKSQELRAGVGLKPMAQSGRDVFNKKMCGRGPNLVWAAELRIYERR